MARTKTWKNTERLKAHVLADVAEAKRLIAIGRSEKGQPFVIVSTPPADFAAAIAEVLAPGHVASVPPLPVSVEDERIGEEIGCCPFLW